MFGHRILNHFEGMSYFITKSWFSTDKPELTEDDVSAIFSEKSAISTPISRKISVDQMQRLVWANYTESDNNYTSTANFEDQSSYDVKN